MRAKICDTAGPHHPRATVPAVRSRRVALVGLVALLGCTGGSTMQGGGGGGAAGGSGAGGGLAGTGGGVAGGGTSGSGGGGSASGGGVSASGGGVSASGGGVSASGGGVAASGGGAGGGTLTPLPRIGVRTGELYDTQSGLRFIPKGYNYIVLDAFVGYHVTFDANAYDAAAAEAALTQFEHDGFNAVRVFLDERGEIVPDAGIYGMAGPATGSGLYAPTVANLIDFLRRARTHHVYVMPVLLFVPQNTGFQTMLFSNVPADIEDFNIYFLAPSGISAKQAYAQQLVTQIANADPGGALLSTVLAWELDNESFVVANKKPFSLTSGTVTGADGIAYDMSNPVDRQQCLDANLVVWANSCASTIRAIDPQALVTDGMFTFNAVGQAGPNGIPANPSGDPRVPVRPLILRTYSTLSFTDMHLYPSGPGYSVTADLASSELSPLSTPAVPLVMGEFGAFKSFYPDLTMAAFAMGDHRAAAADAGVVGALFWTWNTANQPELWNAAESNGAINGVLAQ
jgi:hypothetical protein